MSTGSRHALHGARDPRAGRGAVPPDDHRGDLERPHRRRFRSAGLGPSVRLALARRVPGRRLTSSRPWIACATSPRPASDFARTRACGCGSPSPRSPSPDATRRPSPRSPNCCATSSTSRPSTSPRRSGGSPPSSSAPTARPSDPASARTCRPSSARPGAATGPRTTTAPSRVGGHTLQPDEYELALESPDDVVAAALRSNDAVVTLDTDVTPELEAEGLARDVVREIQNARKAEDLVVTDRIDVWVDRRVRRGRRRDSRPTRPTSPNRCWRPRSPWVPAPTNSPSTTPRSAATSCVSR